MCWISNTLNKHVAKQDYTVYKLVKFDTFDTCKSLVYNYVYTFEKLYKLEQPLLGKEYYGMYTIDEGFHAYIELSIMYHAENIIEGLIAECTIPKGATYYISNYGEVVSNQIIIHKLSVLSDVEQFLKTNK